MPRSRDRIVGRRLLACFVFLLLPVAAWAEEPPKPSLTAVPLNGEEITVDGLLDEPIWHTAPAATGFVQQRPEPGAPSHGKSFVRVVYDGGNLYIGAELDDPDPTQVRGDERQRDAGFDRSDAFAVLIDTYHDHQNAFFFETNLLGAKSDALVSQDGGSVDSDWDGIWEVSARRTPTGWSAEFRIPFETLRFRAEKSQIWGIQFRRRIPHLKEVSFWSPLTTELDFYEVSRAGHLIGVGAVRQERRFWIKPYVRGEYQYDRTDLRDGWDTDHEAGVDLRYRFRTNLTLDLTYNTDFAETEVDNLQVNLTRFPLFFPEKREFFLEGKGFYDFGLSGRVQPFFSRRIGLIGSQPVPILGGGKLTGKVGRYGVGFLMMQTEALEGTAPAEQFGVLRLTRDIGVRSNVGIIATHRADRYETGGQTVGIDTTIAPSPNLSGYAFWLRSGGPQSAGSFRSGDPGQASYVQANYKDPFWRIYASHLRIDERFDPALGFVQQTDLDESYGYIDVRPHPAAGPIRELGFKGELTYQTDTGGALLYRSNYWRGQVDFKSGDFVLFSYDPQVERLPEDFEIRPGIVIPAGRYHYHHFNVYLNSDPRRPLSAVISFLWGGFYAGKKNSLVAALTAGPAEGVRLGGSMEVDWVDLPQGSFVAEILEGEMEWSFTNRISAHGLVQWDKEGRTLAANLRFSWEYRPGSWVYLVANPSHQGNDNTLLLLLKVTWLWEPAL
ncbi:MAG TPA: DUF5916 domain-containing protein [Nitrospiria bacterium]|nr:DUF5916 domain-containing protein [Nitrospiria bacterium]